MSTITKIAFPDPDLLSDVQSRLSESARSALDLRVWSAEHPDSDPADLDAVILPYLGAESTVAKLDEINDLKLIQAQTTGYDVVNHLVGKVTVTTGAGAHAAATAELAVALVLARLRGLDEAARNQLTGTWDHQRRLSLADRKVTLLGVGGIGEEIRRRLEPFEVEITRVGSRAREDEHGTVYGNDDLAEILPNTEVLIIVTPLNEHTEGMVNAEFLGQLPDGALVCNVGRGKIVDTDALLAELESGRLHAALDVVDPEPLPEDHALWKAPNTLIAPHVGGNTSAFFPRILGILTEQLERIAAGEEPLNKV